MLAFQFIIKMPVFNFNIVFPSLLAKVFASNYIVGIVLMLTTGLIRGLSKNEDLLFRFPLYTPVSYFLFVGISNVLASYKDVRKPIDMHPRYARIIRAFVLWGWLSFLWLSANFLSDLNFKNDTLFASFYFLIVIAINAILYYYPQIEIESYYLQRWRIGLLAVCILYIQTFFAILLELDNTFKILTLRLIEVSYFMISNCIISMMAGLDREIVGPVGQQENLNLIIAVV